MSESLAQWSTRQGVSMRVRVVAAVSVLILVVIGVVVLVASDGSPPGLGTTVARESVTDTGYSGNVVLVNGGADAVVGWTVELILPTDTRIVTHWGASMQASGQRYRFSPEPPDTRIEPGEVVVFGFSTEGLALPVECRTNGVQCQAPEDDTAPPVPVNMRVTEVSVSSVGVAWDPVQDDHGFVAYRIYGGEEATADGNAEMLAGTRSTQTVISGLISATSYVFTVSAVDAAGNESPRGSRITVRTADGADMTTPSAPTGLTVQDSTPTTVELRWDAAEDNESVQEYRVYEGPDVVAVSTALSVLISGLEPGSTHTYQVIAADAAENESARSQPVSVTLPGTSPTSTTMPSTPITTQPTPRPIPQPTLEPTPTVSPANPASPPPPSYNPLPTPQPSGTLISQNRPATASTQGETPDGKPEYGPERAVDGRPDTRWASKRRIDPSWLRIDLGGTAHITQVRLIWDLSCATQYTIETSTDGQIWKSIFATNKGDGDIDLIPVGGTGRFIQIVGQQRCRADWGYSLKEFEVYGTIDQAGPSPDRTPPTPPQDLRATSITDADVTLTWKPATDNIGIAGYDIYHDRNLLRSVEAAATSTTLTGLAPNTHYRLTIIARDRAGNASEASNMVPITTTSNGDNRPPTLNGQIRTTSVTASAIALDWDNATDDTDTVTYDVYADGTKIGTVTETCVVITGLAANTQYRFQIKARDTAGNNSPPSNTITITTPPTSSSVLLAAGDIAKCDSDGDEATARLLDATAGTIATLGDAAYPNGSATDFTRCYGPSWGRHKSRTRPAPGNHEYETSGATGYFNYFGQAAGDPGKGYYSYDLGDWHIIALNSNCAEVSCDRGSAQERWLRTDLEATQKLCTLAYWHHPLFTSGHENGPTTEVRPLFQALYDAGAEIVLAGHEHNYCQGRLKNDPLSTPEN